MITLRCLTLVLPALVLGCGVSLEGSASSPMHSARVMQSGDMPCFALQDGAATRRQASQLVMVHVAIPQSAAMARDGRVVWSAGFPSAVTRTLQGDECITYGDTPSGSDSMVAPEELQLGIAYQVTLNTDLLMPGGLENRQYSGDFCLSGQADGKVVVHDLWRRGRVDVAAEDVCRHLYRIPVD